MGVVIFASDAKGTSSVLSTIEELHIQGIPYFAMVSIETRLQYPEMGLDRFQIYTNQTITSNEFPSKSLGVYLPFKPDWLIVQRERWSPENRIILEFKTEFGSKVGLIEPNAQILNSPETILETYSKNRFVPYIDVFFDHSTHVSNQRKVVGFTGNSVVVGNPKYDKNLEVPSITIETLKRYYSVDPSKKQVLLYSLINGNRPKLLEKFKYIVEELKDTHQFFYKPYPGEPFDDKFLKDFNPKFILDNVTPILEENHIWGMFHICEDHIGCLSSIFHAPLLLKKNIVDLSMDLGVPRNCLDRDKILKSAGNGIEESSSLWMRSFGFDKKEQLEELLPDSLIDQIEQSNGIVWNTKTNLLTLFDDYNDGKASKRVVEYIKDDLRK